MSEAFFAAPQRIILHAHNRKADVEDITPSMPGHGMRMHVGDWGGLPEFDRTVPTGTDCHGRESD